MKDMHKINQNFKKITGLLLVLFLIIAVILAYKQGFFKLFASPEALQSFVDSAGAGAPLIFMGLQILQVILSPIPGNMTTLIGGALFGFWQGLLYSSIAVIIGSLIAFGIGRIFGKPLVIRLVGEKATEKYLRVMSARGRIALFSMFLMPFFPDDILCLIAGISGVSWFFFSVSVVLARPWGLAFSALVGSGMLAIPVWGWVVITVLTAAAFALSMKFAAGLEGFFMRLLFNKKRSE